MGLLIYCSNGDTVNLYKSYLTGDAHSFREFTSGNVLVLDFGWIRPTLASIQRNSAPYEILPSANYSLETGLYLAADRSLLTYANSFVNLDAYHKTGSLALNTAAINAVLTGAVVQASCIFEIQATTSSGPHTLFRADWTLNKSYITTAAVSTPPGEIGATQNWVKNICVPRDGSDATNPCKEWYMLDDAGNTVQIKIVDNQWKLATL